MAMPSASEAIALTKLFSIESERLEANLVDSGGVVWCQKLLEQHELVYK